MKLNYRILNEDKEKSILILHGLLGEGGNFQTIAKKFLSNYKVYLIDQRNHGSSPHDDGHNYFLMKNDLKQFLDDQKIKKINIIGHSMGGKTAMAFADSYPQYVDNLVVLDIISKRYASYLPTFQAMHSLNLNNDKQVLTKQLGEKLNDVGLAQYLLKNLKKEGEKFKWQVNLKSLIRNEGNIASSIPVSPIQHRTLILRGLDSDYITDKDIETIIKRDFSNATVGSIEGAGHFIHGDKPKEVADHIKQFLGD